MFWLRDYEVVVVNFIFSFYEFLDGDILNGLVIVFKVVLEVCLKVVIIVE